MQNRQGLGFILKSRNKIRSNSFIITVLTYESRHGPGLAFTEKYYVSQQRMERIMLGVSLKDKVISARLRMRTMVTDVISYGRSGLERTRR